MKRLAVIFKFWLVPGFILCLFAVNWASDTSFANDSSDDDDEFSSSSDLYSQKQPQLTATSTPAPLATCGPDANYVYTTFTGISIVPGTSLVPGSQCDECTVAVPLPFAYSLYGQSFTSATVGDNGTLGFQDNSNAFTNRCLVQQGLNYAILAHWDDLDMRSSVNQSLGLYTSVSGVSPQRIFNLEWRACRYGGGACGGYVNFEVRLYESEPRFDLIYGEVDNGGSSATVGVQKGIGPQTTQIECNTSNSVTSGLEIRFVQPECPTFTPTVTNTPPSATATATHTPSRTSTATAPSATATATCSAVQTFTGSITTSDPTEASRLVLDATTSTCAAPKSCPGTSGTTGYHYDTYTVTNNGPATCVTVTLDPQTCTGTNYIFAVAYLGAFDPTNVCNNYLADLGSSPDVASQFSFTAPAGATITIVVNEVTSNAGCAQYTLSVAGLPCAITPTGTPPTATATRTRTSTPSPTGTLCGGGVYTVATATGTVVTATNLVPGSSVDDGVVTIALPFAYQLYNQSYTSVNASSNGNLQFQTTTNVWTNTCLPATALGDAIVPHWDDLLLTGAGQGIYTSVTGTAPNRTFNIEWRGGFFAGTGTVDFEVQLLEGQNAFHVIYGTVDGNGSSATVGVQSSLGPYTQYECNTGGLNPSLQLNFSLPPCGSVTTTPTRPTQTPTRTPTSGPSSTATSVSTATSTGTTVSTATRTNTAVSGSPTLTPTECVINFTDVHSTDYFYEAVTYLACHGAISGYSDGTFRPYNNTTRGQLCKIVVLAEGWTIYVAGGPHFTDVPPSNPFYSYVETAYHYTIISGYSDGTFRWYSNVTRGQLCKIIVLAMQWVVNTSGGPHFNDVPAGSTFYNYVETAFNDGIISGYSDGSFRPAANATRGQISKIVYLAITSLVPSCSPNYNVTFSTGATVIPGNVRIPDSVCNDCVLGARLPFPYRFYGRSFTDIDVSTNGNIRFGEAITTPTATPTPDVRTYCATDSSTIPDAIFAYWEDLDMSVEPCGAGCGVYTSVTGAAPNRIFNIEWRACYPDGHGACNPVNFEIRLYEAQDRFDLVYDQVDSYSGANADVGVRGPDQNLATAAYCGQPALVPGLQVTFVRAGCP